MESSFCVCLTPAISVLQSVPKWCRKEHKKNQVKKEPKSRPIMMNLTARSNERAPSALSSTAPESPGKTWHESRDTSHERYRPVENEHSSTYSEWNVAKNWSSQELKSDGLMDDRTVRPVVCPQRRSASIRHWRRRNGISVVCPQGRAHQFVIEEDETESELSLGSRSFLHKVNDQVRKRQKQSSIDATEDSEQHSVIWWMFMSSTLQASVFMVKNWADNWHSIRNTEDLTMKQMFDIFEKLLSEQPDEIYGVKTINWETLHGSICLSLVMNMSSVSCTQVHVFSDSVLCLGKMNENPRSNIAREQRLAWFRSSPEYRTLNGIDREPIEFEWNIFPGFTTLQLSHKVQELLLRLGETPENFTARIIFMSMFNDISWGSRDNEKECKSNAQLVSLFAKKIWSKIMVIPQTWIREKSGIVSVQIVHKVDGTEWQRRC